MTIAVQFSLWLDEIQHRLAQGYKYNVPHEYGLILVEVWTHSGASVVSLQDLFGVVDSLRERLQDANTESGDIVQVREDIIYLYGLVVNSKPVEGHVT